MAIRSLDTNAAQAACPCDRRALGERGRAPLPAGLTHRCGGRGGGWGSRPHQIWLCPRNRWWTQCTQSGRPARAGSTAPPPPPAMGDRGHPPASMLPAAHPTALPATTLTTHPSLGGAGGQHSHTTGSTRLLLRQDPRVQAVLRGASSGDGQGSSPQGGPPAASPLSQVWKRNRSCQGVPGG